MVFSSIQFLFVFLPLFLIVYYFAPARFRNAVLLSGSLAFYLYGTWNTPLDIVLLLGSVGCNYLLARGMARFTKQKKALLILGIVLNFAALVVFKYADFLFASLQTALDNLLPNLPFTFPQWNLLLPLGISFYTFQAVSYLTDVYRGTIPAEPSILRYGTYMCMFPRLVSGPIATYQTVQKQLNHRRMRLPLIDAGIKDFTVGLGLKVLLANQLAGLWNDLNTIGYNSISTPLAWMGIVGYSLQLYFDFAGYSLMAVGLGKMLGFTLPHNFRHPYMATSMSDFWRRWHITLGSWFRNYVYIPLGGNRKGTWCTIRNLLVVWLFTGLWHGASWNFVLWGLLLFLLIALERFVFRGFTDRHPAIGHLYMIVVIPLSWALFAISDFGELGVFFERLFPFLPGEPINVFEGDFLKYAGIYGSKILIGLLCCTPLVEKLYHKGKDTLWGAILLLAVFWASAYCLYRGMNDPFMYFRF